MMKRTKAYFIKEISIIDPDTLSEVGLSVYKHENGGMFAIDSSFIEQVLDDEDPIILDPLSWPTNMIVQLIE